MKTAIGKIIMGIGMIIVIKFAIALVITVVSFLIKTIFNSTILSLLFSCSLILVGYNIFIKGKIKDDLVKNVVE